MSQTKINPVIIDCDPGTDDAWAIISLLKNEEKFNFNLKLISIVNGNTSVQNGSQNALLVLKTLNRMDVPVYVGAQSSLLIKPGYYPKFFGSDGFCDVYDNKPSIDEVKEQHSVEAMKELISQNPKEVTIIASGPLTNIALLFKLHPEVSKEIKSLWILGGNIHGVGNVTKSAEFNFWNDAEAAHIVLAEASCPIYIFPWETCLEASKSTPLYDWRLNVLSNGSDITNLMDPVDRKVQIKGNFIPCDAYLAVCYFLPEMIKKSEEVHVTVELCGTETRGQMIIDHKQTEKPNANIITEFDAEMFKKFLLKMCGHVTQGQEL
jgi:inosine-uridine nucleoside N-ribohydrolase